MYKKLNSSIKKINFEKFITNEIFIAIIVFIFASILVISFSWLYYDKDFEISVLVEAHGMLFDILVIGIVILALNKVREKKMLIQRYEDEIDDFRHWESDEAKYRIIGNIKRLIRKKVEKIDLNFCYLQDADLGCMNLKGAFLKRANLENAFMAAANLQDAYLGNANLKNSTLSNTNLQDAYLRVANLEESQLYNTNLQNADLSSTNFQNAYLGYANLKDADLEHSNLQNAFLMGANLKGVKNLTTEQLSKVKTLYEAKLDDYIKKEIEKKYPHLFEKPEK